MKKYKLFWLGIYIFLVAGLIAVWRFGVTRDAAFEFQRLVKPFHQTAFLVLLVLWICVMALPFLRRRK